jgi:exodeoxyribonuclease V alpha subunit
MTNDLTSRAFAQTLLALMSAGPEADSDTLDIGSSRPKAKSLTHGGRPSDAGLSEIFQRLWRDSLDGHACIMLSEAEHLLIEDVRVTSLVGEKKPLMRDGRALYLNRFWHAQERLAQQVRDRLEMHQETKSIISIEQHVEHLARDQVLAVETALCGALTIIHGGPGTGKTRTIASLICAYAEVFRRPVWVAAPTAKAGARLMESLQAIIAPTAPVAELGLITSKSTRQFLPDQAMTIQGLLARLPSQDHFLATRFRSTGVEDRPGLLVIDEASMLSLEMCEQVFAKVNPDCAIVLVGDPNQLHSVETGSVFASLCEAKRPALDRRRVMLGRNFRQDPASSLAELADAVLWAKVTPAAFTNEVKLCKPQLALLIDAAVGRYASMLSEAQRKMSKDAASTERAQRYLQFAKIYRLVSARRSGFAGADRISEAILVRLKTVRHESHQTWFEGRMITILKNDPASGLFNGDMGVCIFDDSDSLERPSRSDAYSFKAPKALMAFERQGEIITRAVESLPQFKDAYCSSVHQSQGSEFDHVDFLAAPAAHPLATRELLYTAVTRAKKSLNVWGEMADIQWAQAHPTIRNGGLKGQLEAS